MGKRHLAAVLTAAAFLWLFIHNFHESIQTESTPQPTPPPKATASPGGFTTYQQPARPVWLPEKTIGELPYVTSFPETLTHHPLFLAEYPVADCPDPYPFENPKQYHRYVEDLADCILQAWQPHFTTLGRPLSPVRVYSYETKITSPCGVHDSPFPAFYCSGNNGIYLSRKSFDSASKYPVEGAMTTIHEVFHHIQYQSGIGQSGRSLPVDDLEISRRIELQTICSESRQALTLNIGFAKVDHSRVMYSLSQVGEEVHGSNQSLTYWGGRGFHVTTLQGCNTWIVPADMVD